MYNVTDECLWDKETLDNAVKMECYFSDVINGSYILPDGEIEPLIQPYIDALVSKGYAKGSYNGGVMYKKSWG